MIDWLKGIYLQFQEWLIDLLLWIPRKVYAEFLDEIAGWIEKITPPGFMNDAKQLLMQWASFAGWFFDLIEFNWGMSLVVTAILMRWSWSKIPFVGR
jgi:hypothetical protein